MLMLNVTSLPGPPNPCWRSCTDKRSRQVARLQDKKLNWLASSRDREVRPRCRPNKQALGRAIRGTRPGDAGGTRVRGAGVDGRRSADKAGQPPEATRRVAERQDETALELP